MQATATSTARAGQTLLERWVITAGFLLVGLAIAVTAVSYVLNMAFPHQWLVWGIGAAFAAVALMMFEWPRGLRQSGQVPRGRLRELLILSVPLAFLLSSQVCGLGARACNVTCQVTNVALIALAIIVAVQFHRSKSVGPVLIPMIAVSLIPHCVCHAPINVFWHRALGGVAPTCEMLPLGATLFALSALRGARTRSSTALVVAMFGVMAFIIVGGLLFGFPWQGCVDHPG